MLERRRRIPSRWWFFVIGIGSLVASGIYVGTAAAQSFPAGRILRAVIFGLVGIACMLMYGEHRKGPVPKGDPTRERPQS